MPEDELTLENDMGSFTHEPLGYVLYNFKWGEGELKDQKGPKKWQRKALQDLGDQLKKNKGKENQVIQEAFASGHGSGKSALACWLILWSIDTCPMTKGVVTANKASQLKNKTWAELAKWNRLCLTRHWHTMTKTSIQSSMSDLANEWRIDAETWTKENTEAFAGLHNAGKRLLLIFDEASAIDDKVWEVAEGALTDPYTEIIWYVFGNPTRNSGRFAECFRKFRSQWSRGNPLHIDTTKVEGINLTKIKQWIEAYGWDSDFVRVRVRGLFPKGSNLQFISNDIVDEAVSRQPFYTKYDPLIMTLDIARGGDDFNVFGFRRGYDCKTIPFISIPGSETRDSSKLVSKATELLDRYKPDAFIGDATGVGGPVLDEIRRRGYKVYQIQFGGASPNDKQGNMRAYMWQRGKDWLYEQGALPDDERLKEDITGPEFGHRAKDDALILESKEDMKDRGLTSTDWGDAWALSFAVRIAPRSVARATPGKDTRRSTKGYSPT
jgi:hypothetical protein